MCNPEKMLDFTVFTIVTQIALLFFAVIRFVIRERNRWNHFPSPTTSSHLIPQVKMEPIQLDVSWKVVSFKNNVLKLQASVVDQVLDVKFRSFWGVDIESFHHIIQSPFEWFLEAFLKGNLFGQSATDILDETTDLSVNELAESESVLNVEIRAPTAELQLGQAPRQKYPLVVVSTSNSGSTSFTIIVVHLEDRSSLINLNTHILATFVKLSDNRVSRIEPIYSALSSDDSCVVCISRPATRVSLPCRHASTCQSCFKRLPKGQCPVCRTKISSFFILGNSEEDSAATEDEEKDEYKPLTWRQKLAQLEHRFATFAGLVHND